MKTLQIFTDGSAQRINFEEKVWFGGWAAVFVNPEDDSVLFTISGNESNTGIAETESIAVYKALIAATQIAEKGNKLNEILIRTDCNTLARWFMEKHHPKVNSNHGFGIPFEVKYQKLLGKINQLINNLQINHSITVNIKHVRSHVNQKKLERLISKGKGNLPTQRETKFNDLADSLACAARKELVAQNDNRRELAAIE